jgi:hypothetical protein
MPGFLPSATGRFRKHVPAVERLDRHLTQAIEQMKTEPQPESEPVMRGMKRLANLTATVAAAMDAKADAVADRITAGQARAEAAIAKFDGFAAGIERTADEIEAALGQLSNDAGQSSGGTQ